MSSIKKALSTAYTKQFEGDIESIRKIYDLFEKGLKEAKNNTVTEGAGVEQYSIGYTTNNEPVAIIDDNILDGVPKADWVKTVKDTISGKFPNGIAISGRLIKVNQKTRNEYTNSKNSQWYSKNNQTIYEDKFKSANNLDDIVLASTNYINEDLKHGRKDKFAEFARGDVLIRVGKKDYSAKVIVGFTTGKQMVLYDIIDFLPKSFKIKKTDMRSPSNSKNAKNGSNISVSNNNISHNDNAVNSNIRQNFKKDTKFSLKDSVEETKSLIAVHNMTTEKLNKSLELGGLPMPSIAIIKAQNGHSEYGDVSLVFDKSTIDPELSKENKVYGGDAWTPVFPKIEYKANKKVAEKIKKFYYDFAGKYGYDEARPLYNVAQDLEEELNRHNGVSGLIDFYKNDTNLMNFYRIVSGEDKIKPIVKETRIEMSAADIEQSEYLVNALGEDIIDEIKVKNGENPIPHRKAYFEKYGNKITTAYEQLLSEKYGFSDEQVNNIISQTKMFDYVKMIKKASDFLHGNTVSVKTEEDFEATENAIKKAVGNGYLEWLRGLFENAEEKSGIRNNMDYLTAAGNRRSFEALHYETNLENIVKVMKNEENGQAFFGGLGIWGVSAKEYKSIAEIKADSSRLSKMNEDEYKQIKEAFGQRLQEIATSLNDTSSDNYLISYDNAMTNIVDAVRKSKSKSGIMNYLKKIYPDVTETTVSDIVSLVSDISQMPTEYFEAKPLRAVTFNEVAYAVIPSNSQELINNLEQIGIDYATYENGNESDRLRVLNEKADKSNIKFSLKSVDEFNQNDYNEVKVSAEEYSRLETEIMTNFPNVKNTVNTISLSSTNTVYNYVLDDNYNLTILSKEPIGNIHEERKYRNGFNTNDKGTHRIIEQSESRRGHIHNDYVNGENRRAEGKGIRYDSRGLQSKGDSDKGRILQNSTVGDKEKSGSFSLKNADKIAKKIKKTQSEDKLIEYLAQTFNQQTSVEYDRKAINKFAKDFVKKNSSTYKASDLAYNLELILKNSKNIEAEEMVGLVANAFEPVYENSEIADDSLATEYGELRKLLTTTKVSLNDVQKAELRSYLGSNWRQQLFGKINLKKSGVSLDSFYQELSGSYPEFFDKDLNSNEQALKILEVLDALQPEVYNPFELKNRHRILAVRRRFFIHTVIFF